MKKRIFSVFMVFVLVFCMFNTITTTTVSAASTVTITVKDENGNPINGATVTVKRSNRTYAVTEGSNGNYTFERTGSAYTRYSLTVEADGYETYTGSFYGGSSNVAVELVAIAPPADEYVTFRIFYLADGNMPDEYAGAGDAADYGPSGDDTPLITVDVNITALKTYTDVVVFEEDTAHNNWEFVPNGSPTDGDMTAELAFWDAVIACMTEESIVAFEETGLMENFVIYCLKYQTNGSYHGDGILNVTPPVYVVELYQNEVYFGGGLTDTAEGSKFLTAYDILDQYEAHLKQTITWVEDENGLPKLNESNQYTGTYIDPATNKIHNIAVFQTNSNGAQPVEGSELPYTKQTDTYYLAQFNMAVDEGTEIEYTITYTDGLSSEVLFTEHEYAANKGDIVPAFTGITKREDFIFAGWYLANDGKTYTDEEIASMTVSEDMMFHALWTAVPKYVGTVRVLLDGTYDSTTGTATGTPVDLTDMVGGDIKIYVSTDGAEYTELIRSETGVYSAVLENGAYHIYYSLDDGQSYVRYSDQYLTIENEDRTRYRFFNSVKYNPNGGTLDGSKDEKTKYYISGEAVAAYETAPTRDGYIFGGWQAADGTVYQSGATLTDAIYTPYSLTALWIDAADLYVNIKINHVSSSGEGTNNDNGRHNIAFTVDSRTHTGGDYTEIYTKTLEWDGVGSLADTDYTVSFIGQNDTEYTLYTAQVPNIYDVVKDYEYTVTAAKSGYYITSVTQEIDENGDIQLYAELVYDPHTFDLQYSVRLDDEAKSLPDEFKPVAVNVKAIMWYDTPHDEDYGQAENDETVSWYTISQQRETYERVALSADGEGVGSYPVWINTTDGHALKYHYRIEVVSFEFADGSIIPADDYTETNVVYETELKRYKATVNVTGGADPNATDTDTLTGAYYTESGQQGDIEAVVSILVHELTFVPNGGVLNNTTANTVVKDITAVPDLSQYVPTRGGGYTFAGWYVADENGEITDATVSSGDALYSNVTLIAKWNEPVTVNGTVTVAATYEQQNDDGTVTIHHLYDLDRVRTVIVLLQRVNPNGYTETIDEQILSLDYTKEDYYHINENGDVLPLGVAEYAFDELPDDGTEYRIQILLTNYTATFQNEPKSLVDLKNYPSYNLTDYMALTGETDESVATVNSHLHFTPPAFDLQFEVDASAISEAFRPQGAEILVTCDGDPAIVIPSKWPVISQMIFGTEYKGENVTLKDGKGSGSASVWKQSSDGTTIYDYGIRVHSTTKDGAVTPLTDDLPYTVEYQNPAHWVQSSDGTDGQSQMLIAKIVPKTYSIRYEPNGGTIMGTHLHEHVWSYETTLSEVTPTRAGFVFQGWYSDAELTVPAPTTLDATFAEDLVLYAKWLQVQDVVHLTVIIDHTFSDGISDTGFSSNYNKLLYVDLTQKPRDTEYDFLPVEGMSKVYDNTYWHTRGDGVEQDVLSVLSIFGNLSSEHDYSVNVTLEGYYVDAEQTTIEKEVNADGSTTHYVTKYLKFNPDLLNLNFSVKMADGVDKSLYPVSAEVKVTSWYEHHDDAIGLDWHVISQHSESVVEVHIDSENGTGEGSGSYPVWQWENAEDGIPYYYRISVVSLKLNDGNVIPLSETRDDVVYSGNGYNATVYAEDGCKIPDGATTELVGAYGVAAYEQEHTYLQSGTLTAVIDVDRVNFHANNPNSIDYAEESGDDVFRTYYPSALTLPENGKAYNMNTDGTVPSFYDIPAFDYATHNDYIFKGWYLGADSDAEPFDFSDAYGGVTDVYAHWIETGEVAQENDEKILPEEWNGTYQGYDLVGIQVREGETDELDHHGEEGSGLRFITVLSEELYAKINAIPGNESGAEYGFCMAKEAAIQSAGANDLQYKGANVNGVNTNTEYSYVINLKCSGVVDHFVGQNYRLYTGVVTYKSAAAKGEEALASAHAQKMVARSYIRYYDANGLYRTYYNNYTGNAICNGCGASYDMAMEVLQ